ncbi:SDR family oxidoreductase [Tianweitania sediminis]|uniref:SDR family oxidoreductase n=1 Tax=Tianweitania sediminis TaxID=1502156 RepID=A0A8J7UI84_9HYPH|nr:SDR family oxidoreductase [Tianweitania sediminis]MBP0439999.1 SDR family oxidoreductase [Tianweitania sediminis]
MDLGLKGKVVLVTGGTKGIGFACAQAFLQEGARVAVVSRSKENVERAVSALPGVYALAADLVDEQEARDAIEQVEQHLGSIDVLVNSAGAAKRTAPDNLTPAAYRAAMDAKFFSYINAIDPVVKRMAARGHGVVVNVIGNGGKVASPIHVAGGAANAALMLVTTGLAHAYASQGVRIAAINPGLTETERVAEGLEADAQLASISPSEARTRSIARIPLGRMAEPEEIANAVLFLASEKASYITGVSISMDGAATPMVV